MSDIEELENYTGLLESEGCIYNQRLMSDSYIGIVNKNMSILKYCSDIYNKLGIQFKDYYSKTKEAHDIRITKYHNWMKLYNSIQPYLQCKLMEFQQLLCIKDWQTDLTVSVPWVAGFIEGDGSLRIHKIMAGKLGYQPIIEISNTNFKTIIKFIKTCRYYGIDPNVYKIKKEGEKDKVVASINSHKSILRLLDILKPYWVSIRKKMESQILSDFCKSRIISKRRTETKPYTDNQISLYYELRNLKHVFWV